MTAIGMLTLTLAVGGLGGFAAHVFRLPGGAIVGALISAGALHLAFPELAPVPEAVRVSAQILVGVAIGTTIQRDPLSALTRVAAWALPLLSLFLAIAVASAVVFATVSDLSLVTTLFSTAPGGAGDMTAAALAFDADVAVIAGIHIIRQIAVFSLLAWFFTWLFGDKPPRQPKPSTE